MLQQSTILKQQQKFLENKRKLTQDNSEITRFDDFKNLFSELTNDENCDNERGGFKEIDMPHLFNKLWESRLIYQHVTKKTLDDIHAILCILHRMPRFGKIKNHETTETKNNPYEFSFETPQDKEKFEKFYTWLFNNYTKTKINITVLQALLCHPQIFRCLSGIENESYTAMQQEMHSARSLEPCQIHNDVFELIHSSDNPYYEDIAVINADYVKFVVNTFFMRFNRISTAKQYYFKCCIFPMYDFLNQFINQYSESPENRQLLLKIKSVLYYAIYAILDSRQYSDREIISSPNIVWFITIAMALIDNTALHFNALCQSLEQLSMFGGKYAVRTSADYLNMAEGIWASLRTASKNSPINEETFLAASFAYVHTCMADHPCFDLNNSWLARVNMRDTSGGSNSDTGKKIKYLRESGQHEKQLFSFSQQPPEPEKIQSFWNNFKKLSSFRIGISGIAASLFGGGRPQSQKTDTPTHTK